MRNKQLLLLGLIAKYKDHAEFEELDLSDINEKSDPNGDTLTHLVARIGSPDEMELLAASGARINEIGDMGYTPLHNAAIVGRLDIVEKLLVLGADPNIQDEEGNTPAIVALMGRHPEIADLLTKTSFLTGIKN